MPSPFFASWTFWLYFAVWLPYVLFVWFYGLRSPWRDSPIGRGLMIVAAVIVAVLSNALLGMVFGQYPYRDAVRAILFAALSLAGWYQLRNLLTLQRDAEHRRARKVPEDTP